MTQALIQAPTIGNPLLKPEPVVTEILENNTDMTAECASCFSGFVNQLLGPLNDLFSGNTTTVSDKDKNRLGDGTMKIPGLPDLPKIIEVTDDPDAPKRTSLLNNPVAVKGAGYIKPAVLPYTHTVYVPPLSFALQPSPVVEAAK